ncbi:MAG TPA: class I SAM-dependent methyltransferase [Mycobacteriales bacterium]|nr:class I SAM-dependent methyltransferase [Mycobacteriales bacterium]
MQDTRQSRSDEAFADEKLYRDQRAVYRNSTGPDAREVLWQELAGRSPGRLLDVGCGEGELAERAARTGWEVVATDRSARMVELSAARGLRASRQDARRLGVADASVDCVVGAWVLHYLDQDEVHLAVAEMHRVLRPGGLLVLATQSERHMAELWDRLPTVSYRIPFPAERADPVLAGLFGGVRRTDVEGTVVFEDWDQARTFLARQLRPASLADQLERFAAPLPVTRRSAVITAERPA